MFGFFRSKEAWKWDLTKGVPDKKTLKLHRQALRERSEDVKIRALQHYADLAEASAEVKAVFCDAKVTADVCRCFLADVPRVQLAAAETLSVFCHLSPENCAAVVAAHQMGPQGTTLYVIPLAIKIVQAFSDKLDLAVAAAGLLDDLAIIKPSAVMLSLLQAGGVSSLLTVVQNGSRAALSANTPAARCGPLLEHVQLVLELLHTLASAGGPSLCREIGKEQGLNLLLELTQAHRGQLPPVDGSAGDHGAVIRVALHLLELISSLVPAHRLPLMEADGVRRLLSVLRDGSLPWSVRLHAATALQAAAASSQIAGEFVKARGLDIIFAMVEAFVSGRQSVGAQQGAFATPPRGVVTSPGGGLATPASVASPDGPAGGGPRGCEVTEPRNSRVVAKLLGLADAVAGTTDASAVAEGSRMSVLVTAFNSGLQDSDGGLYTVAVACAQVLFRLSRQPGVMLPSSSNNTLAVPLTKLLDCGVSCGVVSRPKQAQIVYGAWCAAGVLCQNLHADKGRGQEQQVLSSKQLRMMVRLLGCSGPALLLAVGAEQAPPQYGQWQTLGAPPTDAMNPTAVAFLATERAANDLADAVSGLLSLLLDLAQSPANLEALWRMDELVPAVNRLLPWQHVQCSAKRLLHLLGKMEAEYQPFLRYGRGPLLAQLLTSQGLDADAFLSRGVDASILLSLEDDYLKNNMGLDQVAIKKIARIRDAHDVFAAMDTVDGRSDGCVYGNDVEVYLRDSGNLRSAPELRQRIFSDLKIHPKEPISFIQFLEVYPWLEYELQSAMPLRTGTPEVYIPRGAKRQRNGIDHA